MRLIVVFGLVTFLVSCGRHVVPISSVKSDSTASSDQLTYQDTICEVEGDQVAILIPVDHPLSDSSAWKNEGHSKRAHVRTEIKNGKLSIVCECDSTRVALKNALRIIRDFHSQSEVKVLPPVHERFIPKWVSFLAIVGGASIGYFLFKARLSIKKIIFKTICYLK